MNDFNDSFYLELYPDVKKNPKDHYNTIGKKQKRFYSNEHATIYYEYCWQTYLDSNPDLTQNKVKNEREAFIHYMKNGKEEGRKIKKHNNKIDIDNFNWDLFQWTFYKTIYPDLKIKNEKQAIDHFKKIGYKQNRLHSIRDSYLYDSFDWHRYKKDYDDLHKLSPNQAFMHYIQYGKEEGRKISKKNNLQIKLPEFHWEFYLLMNPDLSKNKINTFQEALHHFTRNGYKEDRFYSKSQYILFMNHNWTKYSNDYELDMDEKKAFIYYYKYGQNKNHQLESLFHDKNFYQDFYIEFNDLFDKMTFDECKDHYLRSNKKSIFSFEHYLIRYFFQWDENKSDWKSSCMRTIFEIPNQKLNLHIHYQKILKNENLELLFLKVDTLKKLIKKNILHHNDSFVNEIIQFQNKVNEIITNKIQLIDIPLFFTFQKSISFHQDITFSFVISSFNNEKNIINNILSVIYQNYSNWEIFYTNDASTDKTHDLWMDICNDYNLYDKVHYVHNSHNKKQSYSKFHSYQKIHNENIVVILDGDDWLSRSDALSILYNHYCNSNKLVLYSGYQVYYQDKIDKDVIGCEYPNHIKKSGKYRKYKGWHFTHIKTGFAWLFKKIPKEYFQFENKWLDRCTDLAEMYVVSEIAKEKVGHIPETLCVYNKNNSIHYQNSYYNDYDSSKRKSIEKYVKELPPIHIHLPPIYVIHLSDKKDLFEHLKNQFHYTKILNYTFFDAINGYEDEKVLALYDQYKELYNEKKIPQVTLTVEKMHIHNEGALGVIFSTIELYKKINETSIDHAFILEDDVYFHKNFNELYTVTNTDLQGKDFIYMGYNSIAPEIKEVAIETHNFHLLSKKILIKDGIYGAYAYICSRKFRDHIISLGVDYFIQSNTNLDMSFNILNYEKDPCFTKNELSFYLYHDHLCIPEVRKDGIQNKRDASFYNERSLNLDNYFI